MAEKFKVELLDPQKLIAKNDLQEITNPVFFVRDNMPTPDGLLSNEIFGINKADRAGRFAYIDLAGWYMHPLVYKIWGRMDSKITKCIHGQETYRVEGGELVPDPNGKNGIDFIRTNIDELIIKVTESRKRDENIQFIEQNRKHLFIKKCVVIPAYYRDINTTDGGSVGVGDVNKLYNSLIISVKAARETQDYGINLTHYTKARIQETLTMLYTWFTSEPQIAKKHGIVRRSVMSKTTDYASRLVISAPSVRFEHWSDTIVDIDHCALPLASACVNLFPYIVFNIRRFFENEFSNRQYPYYTKAGKLEYVDVKDIEVAFSDEVIKKEINRFVRGFSNRLTPIKVPNVQNKNINMRFKGRQTKPEDVALTDTTPLISRDLTWCDILYMAAEESAKDKHILITRFPVSDWFGQFVQKIRISTTKETEPMWVDGKFYPHYPKIDQSMIGSNTSNMFVDTLQICNLHLPSIGGDYDGDMTSQKVPFTIESNDELKNHMAGKSQYISTLGLNVRTSSNEAVNAIFNLTKVLDQSVLSAPVF